MGKYPKLPHCQKSKLNINVGAGITFFVPEEYFFFYLSGSFQIPENNAKEKVQAMGFGLKI